MLSIPKTMRAVVYRGVDDLRLETLPVPRIGPRELLVKVAVCGVCPTDIKKIHYGTVPPPRVFGHETAGTIVRVGAAVRGFRVGDRVALHHHVPCLECHACRHRAFAQCATYKRTGITAGFEPAGGGYAEYVRVMPFVLPGVVKIPARNTFLEGAMLEPVNTVLKAVNRLELLKGDRVLVAGQGPIGLMFTRLLTLRGMKVEATDLLETRLRMAKQFGASRATKPETGPTQNGPNQGGASVPASRCDEKAGGASVPASRSDEKEGGASVPASRSGDKEGGASVPASRSDDKEGGASVPASRSGDKEGGASVPASRSPFDAAVVTVPSDDVVREAQERVRGGGRVLLFAHTKRGDATELDLARVCMDEKDLIGSYSADFLLQREVARLVFSRRLDARKLVTHEFPLENTADAIALAAQPTAESLKVMVRVEPA